MQIHLYQNGYLDFCLELFLRVFSGPPWNDRWSSISHAKGYLEDIINAPGFIGIVGFEKGALIGMLFGNIRKWYSGDEFWINEFCIENKFQRNGLGTIMVSFLKNELFQKNIFRITLLTGRETPAAAFYEKNGFRYNQKMTLMTIGFKENI